MPPSCLTLARFATSLRSHRLSKNATFGSGIALARSPDPPSSPSWTNRSGRRTVLRVLSALVECEASVDPFGRDRMTVEAPDTRAKNSAGSRRAALPRPESKAAMLDVVRVHQRIGGLIRRRREFGDFQIAALVQQNRAHVAGQPQE